VTSTVEGETLEELPGALRVGPYRVLRHLGAGGMGTLSLATRVDGDGTVVVLKRPLAGRGTPQAVALARREAAIAASLDHPGIVGVLDVIDDGGVPVLVMEHLVGLTLFEVGRRARQAGAIPLEPLLDAVAQAARALHHLHTRTDEQGRPRGLVHRDISPDNLFVTSSGVVKLLDFGVARADDLDGLTRVGGLRGKRGYFAPELVQGQPADARSDLFALGVTLYGLLCGHLPWGRLDPGPAFVAMMDHPAKPPSRRNPFLPPAVDSLVLGLIAVDREARFPDGAAVAARIDALLQRVPSSVRSAGRLIERFGDAPLEATVIQAESDAGDDDSEASGRSEGTRPAQRWDEVGASASEDEDSTAAFVRPRAGAPRALQVLGLETVVEGQPTTRTLLRAPLPPSQSAPRVVPVLDPPPATASSTGGALGLVLGGLLGAVVLVAVGSRVLGTDDPVATSPPPLPPPLTSPPTSPLPPTVPVPVPTVLVPVPVPVPAPGGESSSSRTPKRAVSRVALRGPAWVQWRLGSRTLRTGPGSVEVPGGTRSVQGRDTRRGVTATVPIDDDVADWGALPEVTLLLRARPWATVKLGDEALGQTPLQPVTVVPGRYLVRFEGSGHVVTRTITVKAGAGTIKVNVDMDTDGDP
jgi:serine/threonine protein kinase